MKIMENNKPLAAVVCGFPGGGTTMLTEVLRQHPRLDSGFEGGFLLVEEAGDFLSLEPYCSVLKNSWQVSDDELNRICLADTWPGVYRRLRQNSKVIQDKNVWLFDKTPRYMTCLPSVLSKVPNVPCIVLTRDPRAVFWTRIKRTFKKAQVGMSIEEWAETEFEPATLAYLAHAEGWSAAVQQGMGDRILLVSYESLCLNQELEVRRIFDFLGLDFRPRYLSFEGGGPRFRPCRGEEVSQNYISEYKENLSPEVCAKILERTYEFRDWCYPLA